MAGLASIFIAILFFPGRLSAVAGFVVLLLFFALGTTFAWRARIRERGGRSLGAARLSTRGLRGAMGWRAQRLSDRMSGLEVVGSMCGTVVALFFLSTGVYLVATGGIATGVAAIGLGLVMGIIASLSTGQLWWRRRVSRRLQEHGLTTIGEVTDVWTLAIGYGESSALTYRFVTVEGSAFELMAWDRTPLVRQWVVGQKVRVRYDPSDPRIALIGELPAGS